ncbi:hypothetical protein K491DRAFT_103450 [Lophiostoma macrostomum CBS 122681]|uniref:Uncharacterized protein n=1 Tax=Lophiostoma macrostomum CBS 122681 TaxID=1314788 RepID=A0A6A6STZ9_9PLEO|nr:hypothetical protein K491DRAFT_103450 [Lophiostoma macrostomum CBS 122681]
MCNARPAIDWLRAMLHARSVHCTPSANSERYRTWSSSVSPGCELTSATQSLLRRDHQRQIDLKWVAHGSNPRFSE